MSLKLTKLSTMPLQV